MGREVFSLLESFRARKGLCTLYASFTNRCYFFGLISPYPEHTRCVFGLACRGSSSSSIIWRTSTMFLPPCSRHRHGNRERLTLEEKSQEANFGGSKAQHLHQQAQPQQYKLADIQAHEMAYTDEYWTKTFQKCPLPESNESSSHYEWDALPLSQEGNYQHASAVLKL